MRSVAPCARSRSHLTHQTNGSFLTLDDWNMPSSSVTGGFLIRRGRPHLPSSLPSRSGLGAIAPSSSAPSSSALLICSFLICSFSPVSFSSVRSSSFHRAFSFCRPFLPYILFAPSTPAGRYCLTSTSLLPHAHTGRSLSHQHRSFST